MSIHLPFKTRCKLLASTDNWKASKATVSGFNSMYVDKCCGRMTQTTCTFHSKLSSWHIMMIARAKKLLYTVIHPKEICWCPHFFWKETDWQAGRIWKERPLECGVQLSLRVYGIWCLFFPSPGFHIYYHSSFKDPQRSHGPSAELLSPPQVGSVPNLRNRSTGVPSYLKAVPLRHIERGQNGPRVERTP